LSTVPGDLRYLNVAVNFAGTVHAEVSVTGSGAEESGVEL